MSFWAVIFHRRGSTQQEREDEHAKLGQALDDHRKALEQMAAQVERNRKSGVALEVAAEALAAVSRGRNNHK